ncbi:MAG: AAA family ATPase [Bdellovibrionales bacterium]|nr:AAA family ATPase [Bdellovibrionales bacterium]
MIFSRLQYLSPKHSFFLFGARGTGKTTLLKKKFLTKETLWIDLLSYNDEDRFGKNPDLLTEILSEKPYKRVVIDEIQKIPKLLDIVHLEIEKNKKIQFILTGSSSRKLKKGGANLLAGRLFTFTLHPLTYKELNRHFKLNDILQTGSLPSILSYKNIKDKSRYLESYVQTYLKEEIQTEQIVRKIRPFKNFLEVSAQSNGQIINYSKIAKDVQVDVTTVQNYFDILSDTYLGFYLNSFHRSFRKQINKAPKFFLFDRGFQRVLLKTSSIPLKKGSYEYGQAFEHFIITEIFRLNAYYETKLKFSYLRDKDGNEIDLIIQPPRGKELLIEIKSSEHTKKEDGQKLEKFSKAWDRPCVAQVWSNDLKNRKIGSVSHYHWKTALNKLFK